MKTNTTKLIRILRVTIELGIAFIVAVIIAKVALHFTPEGFLIKMPHWANLFVVYIGIPAILIIGILHLIRK